MTINYNLYNAKKKKLNLLLVLINKKKKKKDPAEFLQLWGRQCKIHIDPNIAAAADNPSIMTKWQGDENTLIDRFDARSHLDYLEEYKPTENEFNEEKFVLSNLFIRFNSLNE